MAPQPMMYPASSSTIKSRTFSQSSASVRGSRVPSPEYEEIRSWMRSASGKKASRVCMGLLAQCTCFLARRGYGLAHARGRGAPGYIVDVENVVQLYEIVEVLGEKRVDGLQVGERESLQLAVFVERGANGFANLLMRDTKRHAFADQIRCGGKCAHVSSVGGLLHALEIEFDLLHP